MKEIKMNTVILWENNVNKYEISQLFRVEVSLFFEEVAWKVN